MERERRPRQRTIVEEGIPDRINKLQVDKFVDLRAWAEGIASEEIGSRLDEWLCNDALVVHPEASAQIFRALSEHSLPALRQTVSLGLRYLYKVDPETAIELWPKMLKDTDRDVSTWAAEVLAEDIDERSVSISALYRIFDNLQQ